jgi:hypothetical protein
VNREPPGRCSIGTARQTARAPGAKQRRQNSHASSKTTRGILENVAYKNRSIKQSRKNASTAVQLTDINMQIKQNVLNSRVNI